MGSNLVTGVAYIMRYIPTPFAPNRTHISSILATYQPSYRTVSRFNLMKISVIEFRYALMHRRQSRKLLADADAGAGNWVDRGLLEYARLANDLA